MPNIKIPAHKFIVDVCCGNRMFWFDKFQPNTLFIDKRFRARGFIKERPNFNISPDLICDFKKLELPAGHFKLVVWDPPHCIREKPELGIITKKYGSMRRQDWRRELSQGFKECWRILGPNGVLIFKWNEREVKLSEVLKCFTETPLFGHTTGSRSETHWLCFMKLIK
jgi:hypothetical protein